ncbi:MULTISPECIES: dihydrofolate reductase family protein [Amycolatopsis]|uniref:dihydrofolate reductase family protein n=1 Tax=Amycolatopsis TaxID=1813 RepID=UPI001E45E64B|nr:MULTISPECIES: dihydrofolate reductase family protein [Amycolatopsis]
MTAADFAEEGPVDGYIAGPDDRMSEGPNGQVCAEALATGAVISGRRTYELAGRWQGDHHDGVPIHVLTHHVDPADEPPGSVKYYADACAAETREAAGDRAVLVHGAGAAQALLAAGQLDELELHLVPVLLGAGRRLFEPIRTRPRRMGTPPPARRPRCHTSAVPDSSFRRETAMTAALLTIDALGARDLRGLRRSPDDRRRADRLLPPPRRSHGLGEHCEPHARPPRAPAPPRGTGCSNCPEG